MGWIIDPKPQGYARPATGRVATFQKRNPKARRQESAAEKPSTDGMEDVEAHFMLLEAEGVPTAMESAMADALVLAS
jgi:hypothetical protein